MNINTVLGYYNFPTVTITNNTAEQAIVVPAAGNPATSYPGLPSPVLRVGSALTLSLQDAAGSNAFDGHPFKITVAGIVSNPGGGNFTLSLYRTPLTALGVIGATGTVAGGSAAPAGTANIALGTLFNGVALNTLAGGSFHVESVLLWESTTGILGNSVTLRYWNMGVTTTYVAAGAGTCVQAGTAMSALNFLLSAQFSVADPANTLKISEFTISRV
jgi:hypothetical protein